MDTKERRASTQSVPGEPPRKRHGRRWALASLGVLVVLVVIAAAGLELAPAPAPLVLPTAHTGPLVGPRAGTWDVGAGSVAGFRVPETVLFMSNDVVGRTSAVAGSFVVSGDRVTATRFRVDLTTVKIGGKQQPQFARILGAHDQPEATFSLTEPINLSPGFASGKMTVASATGRLAMNRTSHLVTFTVSGRRYAATVQAAGSVQIEFSHWGIKAPAGYGPLGSLADHGVAEFLVALRRQ